ncbi:MAG: hypothetical protein AAGC55_25860, partial [Myxococcota bacterium]
APAPLDTGDVELPRRVLGDNGFWCFTALNAADREINSCFRHKRVCVTERASAIEKSMESTECETGHRAHCFFMHSAMRQWQRWRCYGSEDDCYYERAGYRRLAPDDVKFGECALSAEAVRNRAPRA